MIMIDELNKMKKENLSLNEKINELADEVE
jgi:hypothetical protein